MKLFKALLYSLIFSYSSLYCASYSWFTNVNTQLIKNKNDFPTCELAMASFSETRYDSTVTIYPYSCASHIGGEEEDYINGTLFDDYTIVNDTCVNGPTHWTIIFNREYTATCSKVPQTCTAPQYWSTDLEICVDPDTCSAGYMWDSVLLQCIIKDACNPSNPNYDNLDCDENGIPNGIDMDDDGDDIPDSEDSDHPDYSTSDAGCTGPDLYSADFFYNTGLSIASFSYYKMIPRSYCIDRVNFPTIDNVAIVVDKIPTCESEYCYVHYKECKLKAVDHMPKDGLWDVFFNITQSHCDTKVDGVIYDLNSYYETSDCPNKSLCFTRIIPESEPDTNSEDGDPDMDNNIDLNTTSSENESLLQSSNTTNKHLQDIKDKSDITNKNLDDLLESSNSLLTNNKDIKNSLENIDNNIEKSLNNQLQANSSLESINNNLSTTNNKIDSLNSNNKLNSQNEINSINKMSDAIGLKLDELSDSLNDSNSSNGTDMNETNGYLKRLLDGDETSNQQLEDSNALSESWFDLAEGFTSRYNDIVSQFEAINTTIENGFVNNMPTSTISSCPYSNTVNFNGEISVVIDVCAVISPMYGVIYYTFYILFFSGFLFFTFNLLINSKDN